jgi:hypothetical protein
MNTCGTCKYFGASRKLTLPEPDRREDNGPYKVCGLIEQLDSRPIVSAYMAYVVDGSGYYAALCVSEDFGCNQWAEK